MTPAAQVQAAIEILDLVIASARDEGPPANSIVQAYFKTRRYAGSKDRRAVRELVFRAIRRSGEPPASGRVAMIGLGGLGQEIAAAFDGSPHAPPKIGSREKGSEAALLPQWIEHELSALVAPDEWPALLNRAPLDLRANVARTSREAVIKEFAGAEPTPLSPWGLRLPPDSRVTDHPAFSEGLAEIQDEGSQLIALACGAQPGQRIIDICAGAGGKSLALAAAARAKAEIIACDTSRARLGKLPDRARRAGADIAMRLLNAPREREELSDLQGAADTVLVDAPCSGSGTWRRNPEGRWRLTSDRLDRVIALQQRVLDLAEPLIKPGGKLVYAVCSLLMREGTDQISGFLGRHSGWTVQDPLLNVGRWDGAGKLLTPGHDRTDGFFIACLARP